MATIRTAIQIYDGMSPAFKSMNNAMNIVLSSFESLQRASSNAIDTASIQAARQELQRAESAFDRIESEIREADQQQQRFNNNIRDGTSAANGLLSKLAAVAATYLSFQAGGNVIALSDELTNTTARLEMVNDGLQTTAELQRMIFDSAQRSYGVYSDTADLVGKLAMNAGDAFSSNSEVVMFGELLNKQFGIAGTSADGMKNATIQLTQALGGGVLRGQELNSIFEHAPNIIHTIADYLEVPIGKIREMAGEGQITADIVKKAMFAATDEINDKFNSMPLTFEQIWTSFQNNALWAFQSVLQQINDIANSDKFHGFINGITNSLYMFADVATLVLSVIMTIGGFMYDNWSLIAPIVWGLISVLGVYTGVLIAHKAALIGVAVWNSILAIRTAGQAAAAMMATGATFMQTAAQYGLNAALYACPITWIIIGIIAIIAVIYLAVAAINKFAGTSYSATGMIAGYFTALGATIYNQVAFWWNLFASIAEFFVNVWNHPIYSAKRLFANFTTNVLDMAISMTNGWDTFATNFVNAIIAAVNIAIKAWNAFTSILPDSIKDFLNIGKGTTISYQSSITSNLSHLKNGINNWVGDAPSGYWEAPKMSMKSIGNAYNTGYNWGSGVADKLSGALDIGSTFEDLMGKVAGVSGANSPVADKLDKVGKDGAKTAANTAKMAKSMEATEEDLKYLRDLAEQEVVNRFTTAEIKVDMSGMQNNINSELDLDGVVAHLEQTIYEKMSIAAEGDHI